MTTQIGITEWLGRPLDPIADPWYRFARVIATVTKCTVVPRGARWLDVGCQMGQFLRVAEHHFGIAGSGIDGFETSEIPEICIRHLHLGVSDPGEILDGSWRYFTRDVDKVGFAIDEKFEFISALEVIEHLINTDAFLDECRRHLTDNGRLIITTPNINSLRNRVTVPLGHYPAGLEYRTIVHHVRLYNAPSLRQHAEAHGFRLVAMEGVSLLPHRLVAKPLAQRIDRLLSGLLPSFCGNLIAVFQKVPDAACAENPSSMK